MKAHRFCSGVLVSLSLASGVCGAGEEGAQRQLNLALNVTDAATAADAGLPSYPGSRPYKDSDQSSSGANIAMSTPVFGFKVVAMNLETRDGPERVAAFYRHALSKYGNVLECSDANEGEKSKPGVSGSDQLVCDSDEPGANSVVYKVGTEENQRIVAIKSHGSGTRFSLVHVDTRKRSGS
jgi:hypothetical protein